MRTSEIARLLLVLWAAASLPLAGQDAGKIMRPVDHAAVPAGELSVVATAPGGHLELDGKPLAAEERFPNVFEAVITPANGMHTLALVWEGGRKEIQFFSGDGAPAGFEPFRKHPPVAVECTQCHGLSKRGRFRFKGGCFDCHQQDKFVAVHKHAVHVFEGQCGACHNAHGATTKAFLTRPKAEMCGLCHSPPG